MKPAAAVKKILSILDKALGERRKSVRLSPLETAVFAILNPGNDESKTAKAMNALRKEFVDWNEVRVCSWKEIGSILDAKGVANPGEKAFTLKKILEAVFNGLNKMSLDPIKDFKLEETRKKLEEMEDFPAYATGAVLTFHKGLDDLYVTPSLVRICNRVGILNTSSLSKARKDLDKLVPKKDRYRFQQHLDYLSSTVCLKEVTTCTICPLNSMCQAGTEHLKHIAAVEAERAKAEEAKKKATEKREAEARKAAEKAAKKKAAEKKREAERAKRAAKKLAKKKAAAKQKQQAVKKQKKSVQVSVPKIPAKKKAKPVKKKSSSARKKAGTSKKPAAKPAKKAAKKKAASSAKHKTRDASATKRKKK